MARSYTSAARRAAIPAGATSDRDQLFAWVDNNTTRAREALRAIEAMDPPVDAEQASARAQVVDQLLGIFPSFELDGERFRVLGELQLLDLCELMRLTKRDTKTTDPAGVVALADFFAGALGDEYDRFRQFCRDNAIDQDTMNDVMEGIVEDLSEEVPTSRPSPSPRGSLTSGHTSRAVSLSTGTVSPEAPISREEFEAFAARFQASQDSEPVSPLGLPTSATSTPTPGFVSFG